MFRDYFHRRRWLVRLAFVFVCVVPTAATLAFAAYCASPWHTESWRRRLEATIGFRASLERVTQPQPGTTRIEGVVFSHPHSGEVLFTLGAMEFASHEDVVTIVCEKASARQRAIPELWYRVSERFKRPGADSQASMRLMVQHVDVVAGELETSLYDVDVSFRDTPKSIRLEGSCIADLDRPTERTQFRFQGDRDAANRTSGIEVFTPVPLPCAVVNGVIDAPAWTGPESRFQGSIRVQTAEASTSGTIRGKLSDADLARMVSEPFGHHLDGTAHIQLDEVQFRDGRVESAAGMLLAGPGTIGRELLSSAIQSMGMRGPNRRPPNSDVFSYRQLAIKFNLEDGLLSVRGRCGPDSSAGAAVMGDYGPLLYEPVGKQSVAGLIRMLASDEGEVIPADPRVSHLIALLPDKDDPSAPSP